MPVCFRFLAADNFSHRTRHALADRRGDGIAKLARRGLPCPGDDEIIRQTLQPRHLPDRKIADVAPSVREHVLAARHAVITGLERLGRLVNRAEVENALREAIMYMAANCDSSTGGICIRLFNNNSRSHMLLRNLKLPEDQIEIIEYFGSERRGESVKRSIAQRQRRDLPFLIAVTNRARMGDAFPSNVEWFLEFTKKAANLNALLQGLLGRACGYGKRSTVIMSDENVQLVEDYKREDGGYIYRTSRHSQIVGTYRRGAPTGLIRLRRDMPDDLVREFFDRLDQDVVAPNIIQDRSTLSAHRAQGDQNYRTGPLLRIADDLGLFEHLERPEVREKLFPTYPDFRIARAADEVTHTRDTDRKLRYTLDEHGDCRFTFREWDGSANHGGVRSRGYGSRDAADRSSAGDTLEPQVNMRKIDADTGEVIDDKRVNGRRMSKQERRPGHWRSEMVTLPLVEPVRELQSGEATYPVAHSPFAKLMSEDERDAAGHI